MKTVIKKWQLLSCRTRKAAADLEGESFLSVGNGAMRKSRKTLEEARLPESVSAIKGRAFADCRLLRAVTRKGESGLGIGTAAFRDCVRLQDVEPFSAILSIGERGFSGCTMLQDPALGADLRRIGAYAFADCASIVRVTLPRGLASIGKGAFSGCTELTVLESEEGLSAFAPDLFRGCVSLRELEIPESIREIPSGMLRDCSALERLDLPGGVAELGRNALRGCRGLEEVRAELGLVRIGRGAFLDTPSLREVYLPHSVKHIGLFAFGAGKAKGERVKLYVEQEYMRRRAKRMLFFCGSYGRVEVILAGKTIEERKRERRRTTLEKTPAHLTKHTTGRP